MPWTHNITILSRSKHPEEREFYLKMAIKERWSSRELERQFDAALFERVVLSPPKVSAVLRQYENPAIGVLLCASKDNEVVEYALSRTLSPALIAQYETQLPEKKLLQAKLHEFYLMNMAEREE